MSPLATCAAVMAAIVALLAWMAWRLHRLDIAETASATGALGGMSESRTGAERYLARRLDDPEYRRAYKEARERVRCA